MEEILGFTMMTSPTVSLLQFQHIFHGDALNTGMYLGMIRNNAVTLASELFAEEETAKSSTYREVKVS